MKMKRILFRRNLGKDNEFDTITFGVIFDAIIGVHRGVIPCRKKNNEKYLSAELKAFKIDLYIKIESRIYPILNLEKFVDFSLLKNLLKNHL